VPREILHSGPPVPGDTLRPEREDTDQSLSAERHAADGTAPARALEEHADRIVDLARTRADAVLTEARESADQTSSEPVNTDGAALERMRADETLQEERAADDEILRREREDSARLLSALLPLMRTNTDGRLLTERASSDAALSHRDDFLGMVSHDLNNQLGGIVLGASMLRRQASDSAEGRRVVTGTDRILLCAARMKRLLGDLTDVTRLSAGKLAVTIASTDETRMVAEVVATFGSLAAEKGVALSQEVDGPPLLVACDRGRITQVLANLVGNALKFTPAGGRVTMRVSDWGDEACFSVCDTGCGIPEPLLEAVFERFWQAGEDDRRGLGLGLYIAKSIVDAHGGRIWAESVVGSGSTFQFTLPRAVPETAH
jgi:signal transduction histidine kinase